MINDNSDVITEAVTRQIVPLLQLFGLYVIAHGHTSPGGGFQGGVIVAATFILLVLAFGWHETYRRIGERAIIMLAVSGVALYLGTGILCMFRGGNFLDYSVLTGILGNDPIKARYYAMTIVEYGVGLAVFATMVSIFLDLITGGRHEDALDEVSLGA